MQVPHVTVKLSLWMHNQFVWKNAESCICNFLQVETLAKQALHDPVEIQVGGRSVVNKDITQLIEIRPEADRFLRLLEILGEFYEAGKILIFVASQDLCDNLFRDLLKVRHLSEG